MNKILTSWFLVLFSVINDNYEQLDAIATCFPWCTNATNRFSVLPKNMQGQYEVDKIKIAHTFKK